MSKGVEGSINTGRKYNVIQQIDTTGYFLDKVVGINYLFHQIKKNLVEGRPNGENMYMRVLSKLIMFTRQHGNQDIRVT